ncbi:hypothetical protein E3Q23_03859 [Wallemia mellicola]|uniref:BTB domain-containing protein n=1 Tax=Wallemia mellicola TaxID=1708541 RepID=A0A4T0TCY6_9BASI|nr:hypothetical protein E3Q23_03859 [Wallemia mellicola]TIC62620.1 hypothetical protein E3Q01_03834 [Wallemia mellicola]
MNPLFYYLLQKDINNFKNALETSTKPSSLSKSWQSSTEQRYDVNMRDERGRTVLHLIATMEDNRQLEFAKSALSQVNINVNLQDAESGWTALHRGIYSASLGFVRLLLSRDDVDLSIKDREGYTAFDLYNLTVDDAYPDPHHSARSELYTWGANRNYVLGNTHGNDRQLPERISVERQNQDELIGQEMFRYLDIKKVFMSKNHTGIMTNEEYNNIRFCGFGNNGRLGRSVHTQHTFDTVSPSLPFKVADMALGPDHSLLISTEGHVYSFGSNKYQQLGYSVDAPVSQHAKFASTSDPFQTTPKRIVGVLKREVMEGISAGKTASACWKADSLFTWGTNEGHLGYDQNSTPVQSAPRKVTSIKQNVIDVVISDRSMVNKDYKDFDVGPNGTVILCTQAGSVFIKNAKTTIESIPSGWKENSKVKSSKFSRIPYLHRVSTVYTSDSGAFAALRNPPSHHQIFSGGCTIGSEIEKNMYLGHGDEEVDLQVEGKVHVEIDDDDSHPEDEDDDVGEKILECKKYFQKISQSRDNVDVDYSDTHVGAFDMKLLLNDGGVIPIHKAIYAARSPILRTLIEGTEVNNHIPNGFNVDKNILRFHDELSHPLALFILNKYIYTDSLLPIWDPRIEPSLRELIPHDQVVIVRDTLKVLSKALKMSTLEPYLDRLVVRDVPKTLHNDLQERLKSGVPTGDVRLNFMENKSIIVDSVLLKSRIGFFSAMFNDNIWTIDRRSGNELIDIDLSNMRLEIFTYITKYIYGHTESTVFADVAAGHAKEYIDIIFEVLQYANELMIDKMKLICAATIRPFITLNTAQDIAERANYLECHELVDSIMEDLTTQLESALEKHALDDLSDELLNVLNGHIRKRQDEHSPIRQVYQALLDVMVESNREWLNDQDIPQPILQTHIKYWNKTSSRSPKFGPSSYGRSLIMSPTNALRAHASPPVTPDIAPLSLTSTANIPPIDDIFDMDDDKPMTNTPGTPASGVGSRGGPSPWQNQVGSTESAKVHDFRSIVESEAANTPVKTYSQSPLAGAGFGIGKLSQKEKRRLQQERERQEKVSVSASPGSSTPAWRVPERRTSAWNVASNVGNSPSSSQQISKPPRTDVIVPTREKGKKISSHGNAWSQAPAFASPPVATPEVALSTSLADNSFEAIQIEQLGLSSQSASTTKKKSMIEIQNEEKEREEEQAFLKWWEEEERRTKEAMGLNYQRPIPAGKLPVYDLALEVLAEDKKRVQRELQQLRSDKRERNAVDQKEYEKRIKSLEILEGSNDPEVRYNFENGNVDMSKPYYRYLAEKDFLRGGRKDKLLERLHQMNVVPDVVPPFTPSVELVLDFPKDEQAEGESAVRPVIAGSFVRPGLSFDKPSIGIKIFDGRESLYSLLIVDPGGLDYHFTMRHTNKT